MPSKKTLKRHISDARVRMAGFSGMPFLLKTMLLGSSERKDILRARETNLLLRLKKLQKKKTSRKTTANEMKLLQSLAYLKKARNNMKRGKINTALRLVSGDKFEERPRYD
ncbi:MAG TPA: hypothetical protein VJG83_06855 [archaeon]|nr:hypothetical protein [archaeon]